MKDLDKCHENQKKNTQKSQNKQQQKPTLDSSLWSCCAIYGHTGEKYISLDGLSLSCSCLHCCKSWPVEFLKEREKPFHVDHFPKTFTWRSVLNSAVALTKVSACSATPISRPQAFFHESCRHTRTTGKHSSVTAEQDIVTERTERAEKALILTVGQL